MDYKKFNLYITALKIPFDIIGIFAGFLLAYYLRYNQIGQRVVSVMPVKTFLLIITFVTLVWLIIFSLAKLYQFGKRVLVEEIGIVAVAISAGMMILFTILFFTNNNTFSRLIIAYSWILTFAFVAFFRIILKVLEIIHYRSEKGKIKLLVIGSSTHAKQFIKSYSSPNSRYKIVGIINDKKINEARYLGEISDYQKVIEKYKIDEVIQADPEIDNNLTQEIVNYCQLNGVKFKFISRLLSIRSKNINIEAINNIPVVELIRSPLDGWGQIVKRVIDILGSAVLIVVFSIPMLVIAILIKLDSKGPVLFRQKRVGKNNKVFTFLKFRSMYTGAHREHKKMIEKYGNMFKLKSDPRVTKIGNILRKTSLDELPQFFNAFIGNMSLVGPRPPMPEEVERYSSSEKRRVGFKPGITGLWQVSGRSDVNFKEWVELDVYYIENWTLMLDFHILFRTFLAIFSKRGAY